VLIASALKMFGVPVNALAWIMLGMILLAAGGWVLIRSRAMTKARPVEVNGS
jgi:hypothetical protein